MRDPNRTCLALATTLILSHLMAGVALAAEIEARLTVGTSGVTTDQALDDDPGTATTTVSVTDLGRRAAITTPLSAIALTAQAGANGVNNTNGAVSEVRDLALVVARFDPTQLPLPIGPNGTVTIPVILRGSFALRNPATIDIASQTLSGIDVRVSATSVATSTFSPGASSGGTLSLNTFPGSRNLSSTGVFASAFPSSSQAPQQLNGSYQVVVLADIFPNSTDPLDRTVFLDFQASASSASLLRTGDSLSVVRLDVSLGILQQFVRSVVPSFEITTRPSTP